MARKEGMKPIHILVTEEQRQQINDFAESRHYKATADYIRTLIQADMKAAGVDIDFAVIHGGYRGSKDE